MNSLLDLIDTYKSMHRLKKRKVTKLRVLRLSMGMTQSEFASQAGIKIWKISFAERGIIPLEEKDLASISDAFEVPVGILVEK